MNAVVYEKGKDTITHFVQNCIRRGRHFIGDNMKISVSLKLFDVIWTNDIVNPILDANNEVTGWDKTVSDLTPSTDITEIIPPSRSEFKEAMKLRKLVDTMTYQGLDNYIENNVVDLASAKIFIKTLAKVTLALCKLIDSK